jgi:hypothetical protein
VNLICGHSELFSQTWPTSGSMRNGQVFPPPRSVPRTSGSGSSSSPGLPTPRARDGRGRGFEDGLLNTLQLLPTPRPQAKGGCSAVEDPPNRQGGPNLATTIALLPTPTVSEATGTGALDGPRNDTLRAQIALLPTPMAGDAKGTRNATAGRSRENPNVHLDWTLSDVAFAGQLLPTPTATPYGNNQSPSAEAAVRPSLDSLAPTLLPTPNASDWKGSGATQNRTRDGRPRPRSDADLPEAVTLLPTPRASDGAKGGPNQRGSKGDLALPAAAHRIGEPTSQPSAAGNTSSGGPLPGQLTIDDA